MSYLKIGNIIYPEQYLNSKILAHIDLNNELEELIGESGLEKQFKKQFRMRLMFLEGAIGCETTHKKWFEYIKGEEDLKCMRIKSELNIRIIYTYDSTGRNIILLHGFIEKNKSDYIPAIVIAKNRKNEIK